MYKDNSTFLWPICIHGRQFHPYLDPDCHRIYLLPGRFDSASTYSSTSAFMPLVQLTGKYIANDDYTNVSNIEMNKKMIERIVDDCSRRLMLCIT